VKFFKNGITLQKWNFLEIWNLCSIKKDDIFGISTVNHEI